MTIYAGRPRGSGSVRIAPPSGVDLADLADDARWPSAGGAEADTRRAVTTWTTSAVEREDVVLFEILEGDRPVGQVFLHDIDQDRSESLLGYHLLSERERDRGIGTEALRLLVEYVREETDIETLVIITAGHNRPSRRIAEKNGFTLVGPPREDPTGACFKLRIRR